MVPSPLAIPLERCAVGQSARLIAYPSAATDIVRQRLAWIEAQGVQAIYSCGPLPIGGYQVLGLGYGGLVLLAQAGPQRLALKLRRTDAPCSSFCAEAEAIAIANSFQIGPQLFSHSDDCLLMEYLSGSRFIDWLHSSEATLEQTWSIIQQLLSQAFLLDKAGLDHGDLRCVTEHVLIELCPSHGIRPVLIDFGKASQERRPANVTTLTQGLFLSTAIARTISERFVTSALNCQRQPRRRQLIGYLRNYKCAPSEKAHRVLLNFLEP